MLTSLAASDGTSPFLLGLNESTNSDEALGGPIVVVEPLDPW